MDQSLSMMKYHPKRHVHAGWLICCSITMRGFVVSYSSWRDQSLLRLGSYLGLVTRVIWRKRSTTLEMRPWEMRNANGSDQRVFIASGCVSNAKSKNHWSSLKRTALQMLNARAASVKYEPTLNRQNQNEVKRYKSLHLDARALINTAQKVKR